MSQCLEDFPENCRTSVTIVSDTLHTDYETAYAMILITACLEDYYPYQREVVDRIINSHIQAKVN